MSVVLYHHPFTRAGQIVWMLEEVGVPYELRFVDVTAGAHKAPEILALNPMGKVPILTDGDVTVTESAAIGLYLADRYSSGKLAPACEDPARGPYLRWSLFAPSVIEPGSMAKTGGWSFEPSRAGWGPYETMVETMRSAIRGRPFILGETFSMADAIFGGMIRYLMQVRMLEAEPVFTDYVGRLTARPAYKRAEARNAAVCEEHGLKQR